MKLSVIFAFLLATVLSPVVSARLTLLRLAQGDHTSNLRGLAPRHEASSFEAELAFRELMAFVKDASMSTSYSYSMPLPRPPAPREPSPAEIPGFDFFGFYSMSMSMSMSMSFSMPGGPGFDIGDTVYSPPAPEVGGDGTTPTTGGDTSPGTEVDDAGSSTSTATTDGSGTSTGGDGAESTNTENLGKGALVSSSGTSTPQTILMVVLVGAAVAVLSAWYVRKNQRAVSSNVSQMTPVSAPLL